MRRRGAAPKAREAISFAAAQAAIVAALLSPLDTLKDVLFSAHMGQHEILMLVAAPLYALARPLSPMLFGLSGDARAVAARAARTIEPAWRVLPAPGVGRLSPAFSCGCPPAWSSP